MQMTLAQRKPDGCSMRQHLQATAQNGHAVDPRLAMEPPAAGRALWSAYCELAAQRPAGMGPSPIPGPEYESSQRLHGVQLTPWEIGTLQAMDRAALAVTPKGGTP